MAKKLKLFNGRIYNHEHGFIAAYSVADAVRVAAEEYPRACITTSEINVYWSKCWGNSMIGITPERGLWIEEKKTREILRVIKSQLISVERGPEWAEFQAKEQSEYAAREATRLAAHQERCERAIALAEDLMFIAITGIKRHGDKITFEYDGHKFEVKEKVED